VIVNSRARSVFLQVTSRKALTKLKELVIGRSTVHSL
jgi:hypothetical protein